MSSEEKNHGMSSPKAKKIGKRNIHRTPLVRILILGRSGMKELRDWRRRWA